MTIASPEVGKTTTEPTAEAETKQTAVPIGTTIVTEPQKEPAPKTDEKGPGGEALSLKLPEGSYLGAEAVERVVARAKELKLTPEQAQAELNRENDMVKSFVDGEKAKLGKQMEAWVDEAKKDTEIGGTEFVKNAEIAKRVVDRFGTDAFKKALNETGLGNHPELVRVFVRIGRSMKADDFIRPTEVSTAKKSAAEILYGDQETNKEK